MTFSDKPLARWETLLHLVATALLVGAIAAIFLFAPTEKTMGHTQRIMYVHISVAWISLVSLLGMTFSGIMYLLRRNLAWDHWAGAAAELGWLCCGLTLLSGSVWAHEAWGTWWTWDPRLTSVLILWTIYSAYLIVRTSLDDPHRRARLGAVVAILASVDLPLIVLATRWFRGIHPASPAMQPAMRTVLLVSVAGFSAFFFMLLLRRRAQLRLEGMLASLEREMEDERLQPAAANCGATHLQ